MAHHDELSDLASIFRSNGDKLLDSSCKLSLSSSLIRKLNASLSNFCRQKGEDLAFQSAPNCGEHNNKGVWDLQLLYDFLQKVVALKILPDINASADMTVVDLHLFHSLRLLEVNRFSLNLIKGLKYLRSHLEYLICIRSFSNLCDLLEYCGADKCQGYVWMQLKKAVFSHNNLSKLDASLEFIPKLEILDLSHNNLTDAYMINCLPHLEILNLSYNKLQSVPYFTGSLCNNLQNLCLHSNFIEDIKDLSALINLRELDLSQNCLLAHRVLAPLSCLSNLKWLNLLGNPLSFHPCHRTLTIHYLNPQITTYFILDHVKLSTAERRVVKSLELVHPSISRSVSFNSQVTDTTVINRSNDLECTIDDTSSNSEETRNFCLLNSMQSYSNADRNCNKIGSDDDNKNYTSQGIINYICSNDSTLSNSLPTNLFCSYETLLGISSASVNDGSNLNVTNLNNIEEKAIIIKSGDIVKENETIVDIVDLYCSETSKSISTVSRSSNEDRAENVDVLEEELTNAFTDENIHMQDSGFFAATRPISQSQSSIGSASSLLSNETSEAATHYESDIEVLTNPSQSSIEVLDHCDHDSRDIRFSSS